MLAQDFEADSVAENKYYVKFSPDLIGVSGVLP